MDGRKMQAKWWQKLTTHLARWANEEYEVEFKKIIQTIVITGCHIRIHNNFQKGCKPNVTFTTDKFHIYLVSSE